MITAATTNSAAITRNAVWYDCVASNEAPTSGGPTKAEARVKKLISPKIRLNAGRVASSR